MNPKSDSTRHPVLFITLRGSRHQQMALEAAPPEVEITMRRDPARQEILDLLPSMEALISERAGTIDAEMIAAGKRLRLIQRLGAQTWDIDLEAARAAGIPVCYWPVRTVVYVAEHLLMQTLGLLKRVRELMQIAEQGGDWGRPPRRTDEDTFAYNWSGRQNIDTLWRRTVGILGFGEIGTELARRLKGFQCTVLYHKRHRLPLLAEAELGLTYATRAELVERSHVVCSLLPYLPETDLSINAAFFTAMRPGSMFVHCGSGAVVDEAALIEALRSGHLGGAALDTYTYEPLRPDDPLLALARDPLQNLILTPHIAAGANAAARNLRAEDYTNVKAVFSGGELQYRLA
jgi:lactate dehydrogenase-like 2-hydroxyacid dehydrogenase